jgi:CRISPR-associated endonuclease/helicase Cas3
MRNEVRSDGMRRISKEIVLAEQNLQFPLVAEKFHVIDSDTVTAIVDEELIKRLEEKEKVDMNLIQAMSVQIWGYQKGELALRPISGLPGMYGWSLLYDSFLGYMAGVLQVEAFKIQGGSVV